MADDNQEDKTEAPSAHRIEKAREEGDVPRSRELTSLLVLFTGFLLLSVNLSPLAAALAEAMRGFLGPGLAVSEPGQLNVVLIWRVVFALLPVLLGTMLVALCSPMLIGGFSLSASSLSFKPGRMNPVSGIKRLFSGQVVAELSKALLKVVIGMVITGQYLYQHQQDYLMLITLPLKSAIPRGLELLVPCGLWVVLGLIPMVVFDVFWQFYSYYKKHRMSRQDIRDEYKQQEGNPQVKGRIRQQMRAAARQRMMAAVPLADVVVTNPTRFAVALHYQEGKMQAPTVVAKGADKVAARIRDIANEHRIPTLEAPPLARALYRHTEPGEVIPGALYGAVAEVLAWVWQVRRWKTDGGDKPVTPTNVPVPEEMDKKGVAEPHG